MADQTAWNFAFPAINGGTLALESGAGSNPPSAAWLFSRGIARASNVSAVT